VNHVAQHIPDFLIFLPPHPEIANYYYSSCHMRAIIFDMDGVLVESMPYHYQAMKTAIKEVANIDLDKRTLKRCP